VQLRALLGCAIWCVVTVAAAQSDPATTREAPAAAARAAADDASFDILEFEIAGNTVLSTNEIERAVYGFLGERRSIKDVEGARKALEDTYQKLGYQTVFVEIPEQRVADGVVRLNVLEGVVDRTRVVGQRYYLASEIRSTVSELSPGTVPNFTVVQDQLAQLNRTPDRQVTPVLKPGATPGTVEVELNVKDELPLHGGLEVNNYQTPYTTPWRAIANISYDNLWQRQHALSLTYQVAPEDPSEVSVWALSYLWRFREINDVLALYAVSSDSDVAVVGSSTIFGKAKIAGLRWVHPFAGASAYSQTATVGLDYKDFAQTNIAAATGVADPLPGISYVPLTVGYSGTYSAPQVTGQVSLNFSAAPRGLFGNNDSEFEGRRVLARASYTVWRFESFLDYRFAQKWGAYGKIVGQWTNDPLIANEQFSIGGAPSVRGYLEAELLGDRGISGQFELRFHPWGRGTASLEQGIYGLVFTDFGQVRIVDPLGPQLTSQTIASVGLGARLDWRRLRLLVSVGHALRDGGLGLGSPLTPEGSNRWNVLLGYTL